MDVYRVGEVLLRSSQPLLPFLAPSAYRAPHATRAAAPVARHCRAQRSQCPPTLTRSFTTSQCHRQQGAAAARAPEPEYDTPPQSFPSTTSPSPGNIDTELHSLLDSSLDFKKDSPTSASSRTSRFSSRDAQANNPPARQRAEELDSQQSSLELLMDSIKTTGRSRSTPTWRSGSTSASDAFDFVNSLDKNGSASRSGPQPDEETAPMKLGPTIGRTIKVDSGRGMDVGRAFRTLEMECARNSVRRDFMRQRFHERPGLKRKRLKSERWRKNFKKNFQGIVAMVQKMRKQGW